MGILSRSADMVYTVRFLRLLTTSFDKTNAFKLGLIDAKGKKLRKPETSEEKSAYNVFHRLVFNIKKLIPGGKVGSFAAALLLLKEKYGVSNYEKIISECNLDVLDFLAENSQWFVLDDKRLSPGVYNIKHDKIVNSTCEDLVKRKDKIRILEDAYPVGDVLGLDVYEGVHMKTNQKIYFTISEISK